MSFFEDLGKRLSQAGGTAMEKTKQVTETARLNAKIDEEQKQIVKIFQQIGEIYYEKYSESAPEEFSEYINSIKESRKRISDYQNELDEVRGIIRCDECGAELEKTDSYCYNCGKPVPEQKQDTGDEEGPAPGNKLCPDCGREVDESVKFCPDCGREFIITESDVSGDEDSDKDS